MRPVSLALPAAVAAILGLVPAGGARAQQANVLEPGSWNGQVETGYQSDHDTSRFEGQSTSRFNYARSYENATLRNSGFTLVDPSVMTGNVSLSVGRFQDHSDSDGEHGSDHGNLLGYGIDTVFLGGSPYAISAYANRNQSFAAQSFGRTDMTVEDEGAVFRLGESGLQRDYGLPYFSSNLRLEQQHVQETTDSIIGQSFHLDQVRRLLTYDGHNGFQTSDLYWNYSLDRNDDQSSARNSSTTQTGSVSYSRDLGEARNRRWDSNFSWLRRSASQDYNTYLLKEKLHIDHRSDLSSDYFYNADRMATALGATTTQSGGIGLTHRLYNNLTSSLQASAQRERLPSGIIDNRAGNLQLSYQRSLPWSGLLTGHLSGGRQWSDNRLNSSFIGILDEAHGAPTPLGAGGGFTLGQPFVSAASISVVDTRGGARLATQAGIDYEVLADGQQTRIVPLLTSAVIQAGDPLLVSYTYQIDPSIKYRTTPSSAGIGADWGWISAAFSHDQSEQTLESGQQSQFLNSFRTDIATLDLRGTWTRWQAQAGGGYQRYDSTLMSYTQRRLYEYASYRPTYTTTASLTSNWTVTDYQLPVRRSDASSVRLAVDRIMPEGWTANAMLSRRVFKDTLVPTEIVDEASIGGKFQYGELTLLTSLSGGTLERGPTRTVNWRAQLSAVRDF